MFEVVKTTALHRQRRMPRSKKRSSSRRLSRRSQVRRNQRMYRATTYVAAHEECQRVVRIHVPKSTSDRNRPWDSIFTTKVVCKDGYTWASPWILITTSDFYNRTWTSETSDTVYETELQEYSLLAVQRLLDWLHSIKMDIEGDFHTLWEVFMCAEFLDLQPAHSQKLKTKISRYMDTVQFPNDDTLLKLDPDLVVKLGNEKLTAKCKGLWALSDIRGNALLQSLTKWDDMTKEERDALIPKIKERLHEINVTISRLANTHANKQQITSLQNERRGLKEAFDGKTNRPI